jgi:4-amino-4-deoxy-L-arabinose transferase-like glycosyltransferase
VVARIGSGQCTPPRWSDREPSARFAERALDPARPGGEDGPVPRDLLRRLPLWPLLLLPMIASAAVRGLWAPDEPRYAEVAKEAWESGNLLVLHLCGDVYADKPPLVYWLAGLCGAATGWSEFAMRAPSLLATLGTAWLVGRFAAQAWSAREARLAPAIYLTLALVVEMGGRLQLDPTLTFLCTASLYLATAGGRFGAGTGRVLAAGLCLGLAALAKGPVAWSNFGIVWLAWVLVERRGRRPRLADLGFVLLAVAPVAVWALAAMQIEPALREELLYRQHLGRMTRAISHPGGAHEPTVELLVLTLPWTPLWLAGILRGLRPGSGRADPGLRRASVWLLALLLFFSLVAEKRNLYLMPAYPAVALLAARWLAAAAPGLARAGSRAWRVATLPQAVLLGLAGLAACLAFAFEDRILERLPGADRLALRGLAVGLPALAGAALALRAARRGRVEAFTRAITGTAVVLGLGLALAAMPLIDPRKSAEGMARVLAARPERPLEIPCVGVQPEGYRFYSGLPLVKDEGGLRIAAAFSRDGADFLALCAERSFADLPAAVREGSRILDEHPVGSRSVLLLGRRR